MTTALAAGAAAQGWDPAVEMVTIPSADGAPAQGALFWKAPGDAPAPLLVGLHTWSSSFKQAGSSVPYFNWCRQEGWHFIHPDFGGPNWTPQAMGSDQAVAQVVEAVRWASQNTKVDPDRVYLIGVSGGGHMALQMAGRHPEIWAGVSAWCGISDIAQWHADCTAEPRFAKYAANIESALGGPPDESARKEDAARRSPVTWLSRARDLPLDIQAGLHDGRTGSVPFLHSLRAFNAVAGATGGIPDPVAVEFYNTRRPPFETPPMLNADALYTDPLQRKRAPVFQKVAGSARVVIFDGGHEIAHSAGLNWLALQRKGRPAVWDVPDPRPVPMTGGTAESGK
jgi:pimeloyl-ACP methyl ester carboxylesterase